MHACRATPTFSIFYILDFGSLFHKFSRNTRKKIEKNHFAIKFWGWKLKNIVFLLFSWYGQGPRPHFQNFNFTEICLYDRHFSEKYTKIQNIGYKAPISGLKSRFYSISHFFDFTGSSLYSLDNTDLSILINFFWYFLLFWIISITFNEKQKKMVTITVMTCVILTDNGS